MAAVAFERTPSSNESVVSSADDTNYHEVVAKERS
jgi:hypothetical protein